MGRWDNISCNVSVLLGKTLKGAVNNGDEILFETEDGTKYIMYHNQDCCEKVYVEDLNGDLQDLVGSPITLAEESIGDSPAGFEEDEYESYTWTFYRLATLKGYVNIRWCGHSNGYYSERVDFEQVVDE